MTNMFKNMFENKQIIFMIVLTNIVLLLSFKACNTSRVTVLKPKIPKN